MTSTDAPARTRPSGRSGRAPGPLGRLAGVDLPPPRPRPCWPGSPPSRSPSVLSDGLRRRVQGRLLRARLGLQRRPSSCSRTAFPAQAGDTVDVVVRADGRRDRPAVQRRRRRACSPSSATVAARRRRRGPVRDARRDLARTAGRWSRTSGSTWSTPSTCRSPTASGCSRSPRTRPAPGFQVALGGQTVAAGRAGRDRLRGHRPRRRGRDPAADVRLGRRRRAADHRRRRRARRQQHAHRPC